MQKRGLLSKLDSPGAAQQLKREAVSHDDLGSPLSSPLGGAPTSLSPKSLGSSFLAAVIGPAGISTLDPSQTGITSPMDPHPPPFAKDMTARPSPEPRTSLERMSLPPISPPMSRQPSAPLQQQPTSPPRVPPRLRSSDPSDLSLLLSPAKGLLPPSLTRQSREVSPGRGIIETLKAQRLSEPSGIVASGAAGPRDTAYNPTAGSSEFLFPPSPTGSRGAGRSSRHSDMGQSPKGLKITG